MMRTAAAVVVLSFAAAGCSPRSGADSLPRSEEPGELPEGAQFDPWYTQYINGHGVPILAPAEVEPQSLELADAIVGQFFTGLDDALDTLADRGAYISFYAASQDQNDLPEVQAFGGGGGWGGSVTGADREPVHMYMGESFLWCTNPYGGVGFYADLVVHELSHLLQNHAMYQTDRDAFDEWGALYDDAMAAGRWQDTYAATNPEEIFAETAEAFHDDAGRPDPQNNGVLTRALLEDYDPGVADFLEDWMAAGPITRSCEWRLRQQELDSGNILDGARSLPWLAAEGGYDSDATWTETTVGEMQADDPIRQWCARYPACSQWAEVEVPICEAEALGDRIQAMDGDVPDYTLTLGACAQAPTCFEYLDCRYSVQYGPHPWTDDP